MYNSQPLSSDSYKKEDVYSLDKQEVKSQRMGHMFENTDDKITIKEKIEFSIKDFKDFYHDLGRITKNYFKWFKTIPNLYDWEGSSSSLILMKKQLEFYLKYEVKYGNSEETYKQDKIKKVKQFIRIINRLQKDNYLSIETNKVYSQYPKYKSLITEYSYSTSFSGYFIKYNEGYVGIESKSKEGYFEYDGASYKLVDSPNQKETDELLEQIKQYQKDLSKAFQQAKNNREKDLQRFCKIFKTDFWKFWD